MSPLVSTSRGRRWGVPPNKGADAAVLVLPCGDRALLVEVADLDAVAAVSAALRRSPVAGQR